MSERTAILRVMKNLSVLQMSAASRSFHTTAFNGVREIVTKKEGNVTTIEGRILPSPRTPFLIKPDPKIVHNACILCKLNLDIKHTDVLILQQFITSEGEMIPRSVTGLCWKQYRRMGKLVAMAQEAGLLGNFVTWEGKFDVNQREGFKKYNTYYDESTIVPVRKNSWMRKKR